MPGLLAVYSEQLPRQADTTLGVELQALLAAATGRNAADLPRPLLLRQTHSATVLDAATLPGTGRAAGAESPSADGAMGGGGAAQLLAVKTADCIPLLAADGETGRFAALHAGWRGAAGGILPNLLAAWREAGSSLAAVHLLLAPHIRACCYEVQADCLAQFAPGLLQGAVLRRAGRTYLELATVLRTQARALGLTDRQFTVSAACTYCHATPDGRHPFASYRRASHAGHERTGTNVAVIGHIA